MALAWMIGSSAWAASPLDEPVTSLPFTEVKKEGTLLFSDSPEYADQNGILYEGTVAKGKGRIYYYHVNETGAPAKIVVYGKSKGKAPLTITRTVQGEASSDYIPTGATLSFNEVIKEDQPKTVTLPKKEKTILFDEENHIKEHDLVSGMIEVETKNPVTIGVAILPDDTEDVKGALEKAEYLTSDSHEMRGTFAGDIYLENRTWDFAKGAASIDIGSTIPFQKGTDEVSHVERENTGDYGITYHITFHNEGRGKYNLYINPQGGVYMGSFQIGTHPRIMRVYRTDDTLGRRWFGNGTDRDYISCGTWDMGKDLYIRFIPAGATYLPIRFLMIPVKDHSNQ